MPPTLMYFFGFTRYFMRCSSSHVMPEFLLAAEYENPSVVPATRPKRPCRLGPCLWGPPCRHQHRAARRARQSAPRRCRHVACEMPPARGAAAAKRPGRRHSTQLR